MGYAKIDMRKCTSFNVKGGIHVIIVDRLQ